MYPYRGRRSRLHPIVALIISLSLLLQSAPLFAAPHAQTGEETSTQTTTLPFTAAPPSLNDVLSPTDLIERERLLAATPHTTQGNLVAAPAGATVGNSPQRFLHWANKTTDDPMAQKLADQYRSLASTLAKIAFAPTATSAAAPANLTSQPLTVGWHLLSLPEVPNSTAPADVLASIDGSYDRVYTYDGCDVADPWKFYDPTNPGASDLTTLDETMGFWLEMNSADTFTIDGTQPVMTDVPLCVGWNLIGYPLGLTLPVAGALSSIAGKYTRVFAWEPADGADPWAVNDVVVPEYANDLTIMEPGKGYWIYATEATTITFRPPANPPVVSLTSPTEGTEITTFIDVTGSISSTETTDWLLEYRTEGSELWTAFAGGDTTLSDDISATFDPTVVNNGLYELRLTAVDANGQTGSAVVDVLLDGELKLGHFSISYIDLTVPVAGLPISLIRTYDTRDRSQGDFGHGWTLDIRSGTYRNNRKTGDGWFFPTGGGFTTPCTETTESKFHVTEIRFSDSEYYRFKQVMTPNGFLGGGCDVIASFEWVGGLPGATLDIIGNTGLRWDSGTEIVYDPTDILAGPYEPERVRLTLLDGREFYFHLSDGVYAIVDPSGNELTINENGISHSSGKSIAITRNGDGNITQITDPLNNTITYGYDANGDLISYTDQETYATTYTYYPDHFLDQIIDPRGIVANRIEYDNDGRMIALIDGEQNRTEFVHNVSANEQITIDPRGNSIRMLYDNRGNVLSEERTVTIEGVVTPVVTSYEYTDDLQTAITDADNLRREATYDGNEKIASTTVDPTGLNLVNTYTYNSSGRLESQIDAAGEEMVYTYNASGYLETFADPLNNSYDIQYTGQGRISQRTDPLGNVTTMAYDSNGYLIREELFDDQNNLLRKREFTNDDNGNRLTETLHRTIDGVVEQLTTTFTYNKLNQLETITDPLNHVMRIEYNEIGLKTAEIDALNNRTEYSYDNVGRPIRTDYADGTYTTIRYDKNGNIDQRTDRAQRATTFEYDELNRMVKTIMPDGATYETVYSPAGRVVAEIDPQGNRTDYTYDSAGRLTQKLYLAVFDVVQGQTARPIVTQEYDDVGNLSATIDPLNNRTEYAYDAARRLTQITHPDGNTQKRRYDDRSRLMEVEDEEGRVTSVAYDALDRLTSITLPAPTSGAPNPVTSYTYDEAGNKLTQVDARNNQTTFRYDEINRLTDHTLPLGQSASFGYDDNGNLTSYTDFNGATTTFTFDEMNRLERKNFPGGDFVAYTYTDSGMRATVVDSRGTTSYSYDALDRLTALTQPDSTVISYTYDINGNLTTINSPVGSTTYGYNALRAIESVTGPMGTTAYGYDVAGNQRQLTAADGTVSDFAFDNRQRLTSITHRNSGGTTIGSYAYQLSPVGLRTQVTEADGSVVTYGYDEMNRLISEVRTGSFAYDIAYQYDAVSNRTQMVENGVTTAYTYDNNDRLLTAANLTFSYDDNGNTTRISDGTAFADYTYDIENRLRSVTESGIATSYSYDADGNRVEQSGPAGDVAYLIDQMNPTGYAQVLEERNGSGSLLANYSYGRDQLAMQRGGTNSFYHQDGQLSTRLLTQGGAVSDSYTYDAFGNLRSPAAATENAYQYTGEAYDSDLGMVYLRARYYNPAVGRFMSQDPLQGRSDDPLSQHRYLYGHASPMNAIDPSGEFSIMSFSFAQAAQNALRSYNVASRIKKICQFKSFTEGVGTALLGVNVGRNVTQLVGGALDLSQLLQSGSWEGQQVTPSISWDVNHPYVDTALEEFVSDSTISKVQVKHYYKRSSDVPVGFEPWLEVKAETFGGIGAGSEVSLASPQRMIETAGVGAEKELFKLPATICGIEVTSLALKMEAKGNVYAGTGEASLFVTWALGAGLFETKFTLVKLSNSGVSGGW